MKITEGEKYRARHTDLVMFLKKRGYVMKKFCTGVYMLAENPDLLIYGCHFRWFSKGYEGDAVDFLCCYQKLTLKQAYCKLLEIGEEGVEVD